MPFNLAARVKNMTRETKLGLVVSCSFLCLLGVVVGLKMTEAPEEEPGPEVAAAAPDQPTPPPAQPAEEKGTPAPAQTAEPPLFPKVAAAPIRLTSGATSPSAPAPPAGGIGSKSAADLPAKKTEGAAGQIELPPLPPPAPGDNVAAGAGGKQGEKTGIGVVSSPAPLRAGPPPPSLAPALPPMPAGGEKPPGPAGWGAVLAKGPAEATAPPTTGRPGERAGSAVASATGALPALPPLPDAPPAGPPVPEVTPTLRPEGQKPAPRAGATGAAAPTGPQAKAGGNTGGVALPDLPPAPPPGGKKETEPVAPALPPPAPPPGGTTGTTGTAGAQGTAGAPADKPKEDIPTIDVGKVDGSAAGAAPRLVPMPAVPPAPPVTKAAPAGGAPARAADPIHVGVAPAASVPPLSVAPAPAAAVTGRAAQPEVITYTEESYVANAGDSFKSVSLAKYGTDKYAAALYHFNRGHPLAEDDLPEDGSLRPRQKVYVPPADILESRYPEQVKGAAPEAKPGVTVGAGPQTKPAAAPLSYRVAASGEFEYDIARKLLGDGERWLEIHNLNPGWDPARPVPAGTTIQLPADARLP